MIVVDTNVVSELMRPSPDPRVVRWLERTGDIPLTTTAITVAEVEYGLARLPTGTRTHRLRAAATTLWKEFADDILPFDAKAASAYASLVSSRQSEGRPISVFDAQIAAICSSHGAGLATRNVRDFEGVGLTLVDPWR